MFDIIGAGIGGLTLALALEQKGFDVRIFEQSPEIRPIGAGIILANNAMQVFKELGIDEILSQQGNSLFSVNITNPNLRPISKVDLHYFEQKNKVGTVAIHRGKLQQTLLSALKRTSIFLDHKVTGIKQQSDKTQLTFENGTVIQSDFTIGADGIYSTIRSFLFPSSKLRDADQICWRGVADFKLPIAHQNELNEAWNTETRFGYVQIAINKVYWYALKSGKENAYEATLSQIANCFDGFNPMVQQIIKATDPNHIHTAKIEDLNPMKEWFSKHVCLIGDAAHAATPNMGQGACQAIEDAYTLAQCLTKYSGETAYKHFQELRFKKANSVVNTSWRIGKIAHTSSSFVANLRNLFFKLTPNKLARKQSERLFKLTQP